MTDSVTIFNKWFGEHIGGTEAYAAEIIKLFDGKAKIYLKPSKNARKYDLKEYLKKYYDIFIDNPILPGGPGKDGLFINVSWNEIINRYKYGIHIIHFSGKLKIRLRKNPYKFFLYILEKIFYPRSYSYYLCNSKFTEYYFKQNWPEIPTEKIKVLYPPVKLFSYNPLIKKKRQIVTCSRFNPEKKVGFLLDIFNKHFQNDDCRLVLAGSLSDENNEPYYNQLKALNYENVEFFINPDREKLNALFNESLVFWHAKGYGEEKPGLFEHFGMTTVEAMSAGLIPVVINKGGQSEIVDHEINGFKWDTPEELVSYTRKALALSCEETKRISENAVEKSKMFGLDNFEKEFLSIVSGISIEINKPALNPVL
ncbi:hypothetical protein FACS1894161_1780 [Spirochaetia bacterium]|nr:hypothetical protein FACS1894161_1780 [Spirochaetia bacterium]